MSEPENSDEPLPDSTGQTVLSVYEESGEFIPPTDEDRFWARASLAIGIAALVAALLAWLR